MSIYIKVKLPSLQDKTALNNTKAAITMMLWLYLQAKASPLKTAYSEILPTKLIGGGWIKNVQGGNA